MGELATDFVKKIYAGQTHTGDEFYLQVAEIKKMANGRYKVKLSDSDHFIWGLAQMSESSRFTNEDLIVGSIISVKEHVVNDVNGQKLVILKNWEILQKDCEALGNPTEIQVAAAKPAGFGNQGGNNQFGGGFGAQTRSNNPFGGGSGGATTASSSDEYQPVTQLSPFQKSFKIKVRCTRKGDIREWSNSRGSGKLFSVDLLDEWGGEIQATCFNDAAEKFFVIFQEGKVFTVSKGRVKIANKRYTHITNDYTIDLNDYSEVVFVGDDAGIGANVYDFKTLDQMDAMEDKSYVDAVGVCDNVGDIQNFTSSRTQKELTKRTFRIVDQTGTAIECTCWGNQAQQLNDAEMIHQVIACKAARVSEFNGKSLSVNKFDINPAGVQEVDALRNWWATGGNTMNFKSMTQSRSPGGGRDEPPITLKDAEDQRFGTSNEKADYFNVIGTIMQIPVDMEKRQPWYKAVPETEGPAYKVVENPEGGDGWYCEKTSKSYTTYIPRYVMRARISDATGTEWINFYNDTAVVIMGKEASDLEVLYNNKDEAAFNQVFKDAQHKTYNLRLRARLNEYQGESSRRLDAMSVKPIDFVEDSNRLIGLLEGLLTS